MEEEDNSKNKDETISTGFGKDDVKQEDKNNDQVEYEDNEEEESEVDFLTTRDEDIDDQYYSEDDVANKDIGCDGLEDEIPMVEPKKKPTNKRKKPSAKKKTNIKTEPGVDTEASVKTEPGVKKEDYEEEPAQKKPKKPRISEKVIEDAAQKMLAVLIKVGLLRNGIGKVAHQTRTLSL